MVKFTKMQAYGNDYIYIDAINQKIDNPNAIALKLANRHFGVGSDGLVLICKSNVADFKMRIFNVDGTEAQMCGNALRSMAKFVYDKKLTPKTKFKIETLGGIKDIELIFQDNEVVNIKAVIGSPIFDANLIPVNTNKEKFIMEDVEVSDKILKLSSLSWGNPHTVVFVSDVDNFDIEKYGSQIEAMTDIFPQKTNVTFAKIIDYNHLQIREWERGCGETMGCATGASSAVVIANILGLAAPECIVS